MHSRTHKHTDRIYAVLGLVKACGHPFVGIFKCLKPIYAWAE